MPALPEWLKLLKGTLADDHDNNDVTEFLLSEPIGFDPSTYDGMSARAFGSVLASVPKHKTFKLLINTLGGQIDEGTAMYNMMVARGNVHTHVIGYAASMGAIIAQAGVKRTMAKGTLMVIHNPLGGFNGAVTASEMDTQSEMLKKLKTNLVDLLHSRTKAGKKKISDMMDATTCMDPDEAKELGFIDEVISDAPAWNDMNQKHFLKTYHRLESAPKCAVCDESGNPLKKTQTQTSMKLLTAALAKLGLVASADLTDETAIITDLQTRFTQINAASGEVAGLKTKVTAFEAAQKLRVATRVAKAIENKLIKAERKDSLIAAGLINEASLDFIDDLVVAPVSGQRRGAAPAPALPQGGSKEEQLQALRDQMSDLKDNPEELGRLARQARVLRGQEDMFSPVCLIPAQKVTAAAAAK